MPNHYFPLTGGIVENWADFEIGMEDLKKAKRTTLFGVREDSLWKYVWRQKLISRRSARTSVMNKSKSKRGATDDAHSTKTNQEHKKRRKDGNDKQSLPMDEAVSILVRKVCSHGVLMCMPQWVLVKEKDILRRILYIHMYIYIYIYIYIFMYGNIN